MKNTKYFPFERNKYFYGKLLGVADFECEQKYNNNKRRIINKMIHGTGVVCGLNVIKVDDSFISVENGLALDNTGREILLDTPVMKKLSMFDGFDSDKDPTDSSYVYLCIEYDEIEKEPVHSISGNSNNSNDTTQNNKYKEGCRLYLDYDEPEEEPNETKALYSETFKVYDDNSVCIKHKVPKYVKNKESFNLEIIIEKVSLSTNIMLEYEIGLECLGYHNNDKVKVVFDESKVNKKSKYTLNIKLKAKDVVDTYGTIKVNPENFKLKVGNNDLKLNNIINNKIRIIDEKVKHKVIESYFNKSMDDYVNMTIDKKIYLAKISLIKAGNTYVIDNIENNPFNQRIYNLSLLQAFDNIQKEEMENIKQLCLSIDKKKNNNNEKIQKESMQEPPIDIKSGYINISVINGKAGDVIYSDNITHGAGLGNVYVSLGVEDDDDSEIFFGDMNVFDKKNIKVGAKAYKNEGYMVIALKLMQDVKEHVFKIRWMVYKDAKERVKDIEKTSLVIKPDVCDIKVHETIYFEAVTNDNTNARCIWSIKEKIGGEIDGNGKYTASSVPGIYEIKAKTIENPDIEASTFVIVRDDDN